MLTFIMPWFQFSSDSDQDPDLEVNQESDLLSQRRKLQQLLGPRFRYSEKDPRLSANPLWSLLVIAEPDKMSDNRDPDRRSSRP